MNYKHHPRFWGKVYRRHWKQCWEWQASTDSSGYGSFWYNGSAIMAHRFALFIRTGHMPEDLFACHSCDNRLCVNPWHLWWGTHQENMEDMKKKGRSTKGRNNGYRNQ